MLELREWIWKATFPPQPWLVLGKGPTFEQRHEHELGKYNLMSLNHVVNVMAVDVAHVIDIDVVEACADEIEANARWLLMPRVPHVHGRAGLAHLEEYVSVVPVLERMEEAGRLIWYNAATAAAVGDSPVIDVAHFSSEAAVALLGEMGVRTVRTLGIDGGQSYSPAFGSNAQTLLANGRLSFDVQFEAMDALACRYSIDLAPLVPQLRIYVGAADRDRVAVQVLDYSIHEHATVPVRVIPMVDLPVPRPRKPENRARTGFSFARFLIPSLAGYQGRAVYLDSDMLVLGDVAELAELDFAGRTVLCTKQPEPPPAWKEHDGFRPGRQFSVMLLDCGALQWDIREVVAGLDDGDLAYETLLFELGLEPEERVGDWIPPEWNHLEHYEPGVTRLVHFTVVPTQPWRDATHPLAPLWDEHYRGAVAAGFVDPDTVRRLVSKGKLRADLLDALPSAPVRGYRPATAAEVALTAARRRLDYLEARTLTHRVRRGARPLRRYLARIEERWPGGTLERAIAGAEKLADRALS